MALVTEIHPDDEMLKFLRASGHPEPLLHGAYLSDGHAIAVTIEHVFGQLGRRLDALPSLLDFASGYGRVARFLSDKVGAARLTVSDVYADGVKFQQQVLGVRGFVSKSDPRDVAIETRHAAVTCISLFTHLPRRTFGPWLGKLASACERDGVLLFTTHGRALDPGSHATERGDDFAFLPVSESASLDVQEYGSTYVTPAFVERVVREHCPGRRVIAHLEKGLRQHQDIYVVGAEREPTHSLVAAAFPTLYVDGAGQETGRIVVHGWAARARDHGPVDSVRVFSGDALLGEAALGVQRDDVAAHFGDDAARHAGFDGAFALRTPWRHEVLRVEANASGEVTRAAFVLPSP